MVEEKTNIEIDKTGLPGTYEIHPVERSSSKSYSVKIRDNAVLKAVIMRRGILHRETSFLKRVRRCDVCPLGAKVITRVIRNKQVVFTIPNRCQFYEKGKVKCDLSVEAFSAEMQIYYKYGDSDTIELHKAVIMKLLSAATLGEQVDLATDGKVKFGTIDIYDKAGKQISDLNKQLFGELNKNVNVNMNLSDAILDAYKKRKENVDKEQKVE